MRDLAMGGMFFLGLLIAGLVALSATLLLQPLIFSVRGLGHLPCHPLWELSLYIIFFLLFLQEVNTLGFTA